MWLKTAFFFLGKSLKSLPIAYIIEQLITYSTKFVVWFTESILDNYVVELCKAGKLIWELRKEKLDIDLIIEFRDRVNEITDDYIGQYK